VLNSPGTIDNNYTGEIMVILKNHGEDWYKFAPGDKVAQLIVAPVVQAEFEEVEELEETDRGTGGFGSTGT
jgi:dUTP pyrophosphatase